MYSPKPSELAGERHTRNEGSAVSPAPAKKADLSLNYCTAAIGTHWGMSSCDPHCVSRTFLGHRIPLEAESTSATINQKGAEGGK